MSSVTSQSANLINQNIIIVVNCCFWFLFMVLKLTKLYLFPFSFFFSFPPLSFPHVPYTIWKLCFFFPSNAKRCSWPILFIAAMNHEIHYPKEGILVQFNDEEFYFIKGMRKTENHHNFIIILKNPLMDGKYEGESIRGKWDIRILSHNISLKYLITKTKHCI